MKRIVIILVLISTSLLLTATPRSKGFAGSFMMRAKGSDAIFWNPANLSSDESYMEVPFSNMNFSVSNNAFTVDTYNSIAGEFIDEKMKEKILEDVDGSLVFNAEASVQEFAWNNGNTGLGLRTHFALNGKFSEKYLRLVLYGNTLNNYEFSQENNSFDFLSYMDFTWSYGGIKVPYISEYFPTTMGISLSALIGLNNTETKEYAGHFSNGLEGDDIVGADFIQDITLHSSTGGLGYKGMLGFATEPLENLKLGLTFDNIFARINWTLDNQELHYIVWADSIFVMNLDEDFYYEEHTSEQIKDRTTKLPFTFAIGSIYEYKKSSVSLDYRQSSKTSSFTSDKPDFSMAAETMWAAMPIQVGIRFGNSVVPTIFSWGLGYRSDYYEFGFNIQSYDSIIPGSDSKGTALGIHWRTKI